MNSLIFCSQGHYDEYKLEHSSKSEMVVFRNFSKTSKCSLKNKSLSYCVNGRPIALTAALLTTEARYCKHYILLRILLSFISPKHVSHIHLIFPGVIKRRYISVFSSFEQHNHDESGFGRIAQSVMCLATDASLTADPGVASSIPALSHTFMKIDHAIISTVILLPSAESFKKGCCQLHVKVCARSTG